jgi:hypothetical protein
MLTHPPPTHSPTHTPQHLPEIPLRHPSPFPPFSPPPLTTTTPCHHPQEKEKLYLELKNILARQPGPEVAEQLSLYQAGLREKTKQLKAMASELNMYRMQVSGGGGGGWVCEWVGGGVGNGEERKGGGGRRQKADNCCWVVVLQACRQVGWWGGGCGWRA